MRTRVAAVLAVAVVLLALATGACGRGQRQANLGIKRMTLDLTFKDQSKAAKPATIPQIIEAQQPVPAVVQVFGAIDQAKKAPTPSPTIVATATSTCPTAPEGARPTVPVAGIVGRPPTAGIYPQHNRGTFTLDGALKLKGPFPPITSMEIANVKDVTTTDATGQATRTITYEVIERNPLSTTTTSYSSSATELDLVTTTTQSNTGTTTFTPTPSITIMQYGGEGSSWKSAGIDQQTGTAMVVQGTIEKREAVDVCGTMVDAYKVVSSEQVTNISTGYNSQTNANDPNVYDVATQFGGLMVHQHIDTDTTFVANGSQSTLTLIYDSTIDTTTPFQARKSP